MNATNERGSDYLLWAGLFKWQLSSRYDAINHGFVSLECVLNPTAFQGELNLFHVSFFSEANLKLNDDFSTQKVSKLFISDISSALQLTTPGSTLTFEQNLSKFLFVLSPYVWISMKFLFKRKWSFSCTWIHFTYLVQIGSVDNFCNS